jgi:hypothetical protein
MSEMPTLDKLVIDLNEETLGRMDPSEERTQALRKIYVAETAKRHYSRVMVERGFAFRNVLPEMDLFLDAHTDELSGGVDAQPLIKDASTLMQYGEMVYQMQMGTIALAGSVERADLSFLDKALPIMRSIPFSREEDNLADVRSYGTILMRCDLLGDVYSDIKEFLLDADKQDGIVASVSDPVWVDAVMNPVGRRPMVASHYLNSEGKKIERAAVTSLIHSYSYFGDELENLQEHASSLAVEGLSADVCTDPAVVLELGAGYKKLSAYLEGIVASGMQVGKVYLVDASEQVLTETKEALVADGIQDEDIVTVHSSFEALGENDNFKAYLAETSRNKHTTFFGTTCCNMYPETLFDLLQSTDSAKYVLGAYTLEEAMVRWEGLTPTMQVLQDYCGDEMRVQAEKGVELLGLTPEQVDDCSYVPNIYGENWKDAFLRRWEPGIQERWAKEGHFGDNFKRPEFGDLFDQVWILRAQLRTNDETTVKSGAVYPEGSAFSGFYSIKYSPEQFRGLMDIGGYDIVSERENKGTRLYVLTPMAST